ncbi:MAG TPA: cation diffusion facilitator family transporter [Ktedonobacterales bacterium]|nr:cation diffusion facilitator family transporter [Ktedonobacterales bacterium]
MEAHTEGHTHRHDVSWQMLRLGFLLTLAILVIEAVGGVLAHSLALLSDAGHILTDIVALGLAWFAAAQAERPANERSTFGYHRVGILTALANGLTLVIIAIAIAFEAYHRLRQPEAVAPLTMFLAAGVALIVNVYIARTLHAGHTDNLNVRAAALHVIGDIGASAGVILGAVLIAVTAVRLIRETLNILLEATPQGLSIPRMAVDMRRIEGVRDVHDLHVWTIASGMRALSCHAIVDDIPPSKSAMILDRLTALLRTKYDICHTTIQFESTAHTRHEGCACDPNTSNRLYCELQTRPSHSHGEHVAEHAQQRA